MAGYWNYLTAYSESLPYQVFKNIRRFRRWYHVTHWGTWPPHKPCFHCTRNAYKEPDSCQFVSCNTYTFSHFTVQASMLSSVANQSQSASGLRSVATGNWGCGSSQFGDPQLKLVVQWLAASVAGMPCLYYYTCGHHRLLKVRVSQMTSETRGAWLKTNRECQ